jgi:hypothetical protein
MHCGRSGFTLALVWCVAGLLHAATLERLSMDDMVQKSTDIVLGRVTAVSASFRGTPGRGGIIYTHYTIQVMERWKGHAAARMDVAVPGGVAQGLRQTFPGAPTLNTSSEYMFFLWTGPSGLTQVIGLSQGLMNVTVDASGNAMVQRGASSEPMVDSAGNPVTDSAVTFSLTSLRATLKKFGLQGAQQ